MNKDQVKGKAKKVEGKVRQTAGRATGRRKMESKGIVKRAVGAVQEAYGDLKEMATNR